MDPFLTLVDQVAGRELSAELHREVIDLFAEPGIWRAHANAQLFDGQGEAANWFREFLGVRPDELWEAYAGELELFITGAPSTGVNLERRGVFATTSRFTQEGGLLVERVRTSAIRWRVAADRGALLLSSTNGDATFTIAPHPHHRRAVLITASIEASGLLAGGLRVALHDVRSRMRPVALPAGRPLRVAVLGGGLAGLAAADALAKNVREHNRRALVSGKSAIPLELELFHLGRELGGKVQSVRVDVPDASMNPRQPVRFHMIHGLHFVWGYPHFRELMGPELIRTTLSPSRGTSTYVTWLSDQDTIDGKSRLTTLNVCDPNRPENALVAENRTFLRLMQHAPAPMLELIETFMRVDIRDFLHFGDIVFNRRELSAVARWMLLFGAINAGRMRDPEHAIIPGVRGALKDKEYLEAIGAARRAWLELLREELDDFLGSLREHLTFPALGSLGSLAGRTGQAVKAWSTLIFSAPPDVSLLDIAALVRLLLQDLVDLVRAASTLDFSKYAYLRVPLDAAFSSPYALDAATAIRDTKFGTRSYRDSLVQVFDGDDPRAVCDAIAARVEGDRDGVIGKITRLSPVRSLHPGPGSELTVKVWPELTKHPPPWRPIYHPYPHHHGAPPVPVDRTFDLVIATLPAPNLAWVLADSGFGDELHALREDLKMLARATNETLNLQLFFRERIELPFPKTTPAESDPPFSISGIEGPFTILADLRRAFTPQRFREIRIAPDDGPFDGTAWDLVGAYTELFTHNPALDEARQVPRAVQDELTRLCHDPDDYDPLGRDDRRWTYDWDPSRTQPILGEVLAARAPTYGESWRKKAAPLIVETALRQLLGLPGWDPVEKEKLESAIHEQRYWFALTRNCHEHNRFTSTEPHLADRRPHARFETRAENVYVAGDWTRNGSNVICMDAAVASGLHAAAAVLERLSATHPDWRDLELPRFHPQSVPGGWDENP